MQDSTQIPLAEQAKLIKARKLSSVELTRASLERIERLNPKLNACITVTADLALKEARRADRDLARGEYRGPLHGIPYAVKDNYETKGILTTSGSHALDDYIPTRDATAVQRLRSAGAVLVAKATLSEFANAPVAYGEMVNPWDLSRSAGGSSGGSGNGVAAGLFSGAMGHDTGGSIRIPSSLCGVCGLKPTFGRISRAGVMTLSYSLDYAGPMARTAEDVAVMLQALAGHDPRDPSSSTEAVPNYRRLLKGGVKGLRLGVPRNWFFDSLQDDVEKGVRDAIRTLQGLGAKLAPVTIPLVEKTSSIGTIIIAAEMALQLETLFKTKRQGVSQTMRGRIEASKLIPAVEYLRAQKLRGMLCESFAQAMQRVDVIISPTTATTALPLGVRVVTVNGKRVEWSMLTHPYNQSGMPALSIPCGFDRDGLPIGLQLAGRPFDEATVLRVAHTYQQETDWHLRRPTL